MIHLAPSGFESRMGKDQFPDCRLVGGSLALINRALGVIMRGLAQLVGGIGSHGASLVIALGVLFRGCTMAFGRRF
jgi:hypothetical protein